MIERRRSVDTTHAHDDDRRFPDILRPHLVERPVPRPAFWLWLFRRPETTIICRALAGGAGVYGATVFYNSVGLYADLGMILSGFAIGYFLSGLRILSRRND